MRFTYHLVEDANGWLAECVESDAAGEGKSEKDAVESLRKALEERMLRPDAVAPPSSPDDAKIELERVSDHGQASVDLGGPGDAPPPR
jgi:hypothetical protein